MNDEKTYRYNKYLNFNLFILLLYLYPLAISDYIFYLLYILYIVEF